MAIQWGILSTGSIAQTFADALQQTDNAEILAVGSRSQSSADTFGDRFDIPRRYASYEDLVADPDIDIIYIGTPHIFHEENMRLCLENGKHVLCEKPFTINAGEANNVIALAREKGLFLMEAMWVRCLPAVKALRQQIADGVIGEVRSMHADFFTYRAFEADHRLFAPELGGGALLDLGVYPLAFTAMILGTPVSVASVSTLGQTGVDEMMSASLRYASGAIATIGAGFQANSSRRAIIAGMDGYIEIDPPFYDTERFTVHKDGQEPQTQEFPITGNKYRYQAEEATQCVAAGKLESETITWAETLAIMQTMDGIRSQWGLRYPGE